MFTDSDALLRHLSDFAPGDPVRAVFEVDEVSFNQVRRLYLRYSLLIHPDKAKEDQKEVCTECTKTLATAFHTAKSFAEGVHQRLKESDLVRSPRDVIIPVTLRVNLRPDETESHIENQVKRYKHPNTQHERDVQTTTEEGIFEFDTFVPEDDDPFARMFGFVVRSDEEGDGFEGRKDNTEGAMGREHEVIFVEEPAQMPINEGTGEMDGVEVVCHSDSEDDENEGPDEETIMKGRTLRRRELQRRYRVRVAQRAKEALELERGDANAWIPRRTTEMEVEEGMNFEARWKCERLCREHAASKGVTGGINIHQTTQTLSMTCRNKKCAAIIRFGRQPKTGMWNLCRFLDHSEECVGDSSRARQYCVPVYTARQVARLVLPYLSENPTISTRDIGQIIKAKEIFLRQPSPRLFRSVHAELIAHMSKKRKVQMAAMQSYAQLLRDAGHTVFIKTVNGEQMRETRMKAAQFIFSQSKKAGLLPQHEVFDNTTVDLSDISDDSQYYAGFLFVPSIAKHMCEFGRKTASADAAHCQGKGPQSYGTTFEVVLYDCNNQLTPICFSHSVGTEGRETWDFVFEALKSIPHFDEPDRVTIVDQEKSIDSSYKSIMHNAKLFLDMLHVKKNMAPALGAEKAIGIALYEKACRAPTRALVDGFKVQYKPKQRAYLAKFEDSELYRAYSFLEDTIFTSQGAESQMSSSIRNCIRSVEPQVMLSRVFAIQRERFYAKKRAAMQCTSPVPPNIEKIIAKLIQQSRPYQKSVTFLEGTDMMEATVKSQTDASVLRHVKFSNSDQTPPLCCAYSRSSQGFPCLHGVAVICEKHGSVNVHKFVEARHLTQTWRSQYDGVEWESPNQHEIDEVMRSARKQVDSDQTLQIPVALPPPRGRPPKNASKRLRSWYERGAAQKRRRYSCALCGLDSHTAKNCDLRQIFEEEVAEERERQRQSQAS